MTGTTNFAGISFGSDAIDPMSLGGCKNWRRTDRVFESCNISMLQSKGCVIVSGKVSGKLRAPLLSAGQVFVQYWAAAPPTYGSSASGSGLPFPNEEVAFDRSPNIGRVQLMPDGSFKIKLHFPNSYYKTLGSVYVKPNVKLLFRDAGGNMIGRVLTITIGEGIPFRSLTWPTKRNWSDGPLFYAGRDSLPIRTQAQILVDSGYPATNQEPPNFWGLAVPGPSG